MTTNKLGRHGENLAVSFLTELGYEILERNYRYKRAEIDLIASHEGWLIFVEVKLKSDTRFGYPEESVDDQKLGHIQQAAENYIFDNKWEGPIRFDIISIIKEVEIRHFKDVG